MTTAPSNGARPRRRETMKFTYAGPFVRLLDPIRPVKPLRDLKGTVFANQPRYTPRSAESWSIGSALAQKLIGRFSPTLDKGASQLDALVDEFGREYGSVLDDEATPVPTTPKRRRRRGSRGARKSVAS